MAMQNPGRRTLLVAAWLLAGLPVVVALILGSAGSVQAAQSKSFYLTRTAVDGDGPSQACDSGFHMASLWEIYDTSNLAYDTKRGFSKDDSGSGPPSNIIGWVRTGENSFPLGNAGIANCSAYTSNSAAQNGTVILLPNDWFSTSLTVVSPWEARQLNCVNPARVWCIEN
jgi:hypothetical protein